MATLLRHTPALGVTGTWDTFRVQRATYYRRRSPTFGRPLRRPSPPRALAPVERQEVLNVLHEPRCVDLAHAEVNAMLMAEGRYPCSVRTMHRILAENSEAKARRAQARHPSYQRPKLMATTPNQLWSRDITKMPHEGDILQNQPQDRPALAAALVDQAHDLADELRTRPFVASRPALLTEVLAREAGGQEIEILRQILRVDVTDVPTDPSLGELRHEYGSGLGEELVEGESGMAGALEAGF